MRSLTLSFLLILTGTLLAAPVPKGSKPRNYFPLVLGQKREFVGDQAAQSEITKAEDGPNGSREFTMKQTSLKDQTIHTQVYRVVDDEIHLIASGANDTNDLRSPTLFTKRQLKEGDEWETTYDLGGNPIVCKWKVEKEETVTVMNREYSAFPATWKYTTLESSGKIWFVDGLGIVKCEMAGKVISEMKSFHVPDKAK